jgi:sortase A
VSSKAGPAPRHRSRWDRPPPPRDWRWIVSNVGKVLIATGLLMFGFVGYQLWGTGLEYAQAQNQLDEDFDELLASANTAPPATTVPATTTESPTNTAAAPPPATAPPTTVATTPPPPPIDPIVYANGDVVARIEIPSIGLDSKVVQGVTPEDLKKGPGHYPDTPMPGELGNAAIAGHRTTYGEPFSNLDGVEPGAEIILTTVNGRFVYRATGSEVVPPSASDVVATTDPTVARLTLTTCHPRWTARERLIVFADLDAEASTAPQAPPPVEPAPVESAPVEQSPATLPGAPTPTTTPGPVVTDPAPTTTAPAAPVGSGEPTDDGGELTDNTADAFAHGWFSDDSAWAQVALWGTLLAAISIGAYLLSRATRRNWIGALAGIVPFVIVLYFFFQNVNRLLPAAL